MIRRVRALCSFSHNFWLRDERLRAPRRMKGKKLHILRSSVLTSELISAQGHQYFLTLRRRRRHKYRMNVPLLCSGSYVSPSINNKKKKKTRRNNHCLDPFGGLFQSVDDFVAGPSGACLFSISCIINNFQFGVLNYEKAGVGGGGRRRKIN